MAGKKQSPRQKMINMMYLVLLAMLAMNVSTEVLDAFEIIRTQLKQSAVAANANTDLYIANMKQAILKEMEHEGKMDNAGLRDTLDQIRNQTLSTIQLINGHIEKMEEIAEYDPVKKEFIRKDELEENYQYWMGGNEEANDRRGNGKAKALRDHLDDYYQYLTTLHNSQITKDSLHLQATTIKDPESSHDQQKRWEQHTFEGPVVANIASLEAMKIDVYRQEKKLLETLNERLGVHIFVPDSIAAVSAPISTVVPAGLPFKTRLFVALSSKHVHPEFVSGNGRIVLEQGGNSAMLTIGANANVIPDGKQEGLQSYIAKIRVPKATGGFEELEVREQFIVRKPAVQVSSAAVQNLYRKCGNDVNIEVSALGDYYDPIIIASQAEVKTSQQNRTKFRIVPSGRNCKVTVSSRTPNGTLKIGELKYKVIKAPKPNIRIKVNGREFNGTMAVKASSRITIQIVPDAEFRQALPADARYRINKVDILVQHGLAPPSVAKTISLVNQDATQAIRINLSAAVGQLAKGTKVYLQIDKIYRKNFKGEQIEDKRFFLMEKTIPLTIR